MSRTPNHRLEFARGARPTRSGEAPVLATQRWRWAAKNMRAALVSCCLLLGACVRVPSVSQSEAVGLEAAATAALAQGGSNAWPAEIQAIEPKAVRITAEGLYVVTSTWFAEEAGLFVPRDPDVFSPATGGDPEYRRLYGNVFSYRIRG